MVLSALVNDPTIRAALAPYLRWQYPDARRIDELPLFERRADIILVDSAVHGLEIKGDADSLGSRFQAQELEYRAVCDTFTLAVGSRLLPEAMELCNAKGYGLLHCFWDAGKAKVKPKSDPVPFTSWQRPGAVLMLLRATEVRWAARSYNLAVKGKGTRLARKALAAGLSAGEVRAVLCNALRMRRYGFWNDAYRDPPLSCTPDHAARVRQWLER